MLLAVATILLEPRGCSTDLDASLSDPPLLIATCKELGEVASCLRVLEDTLKTGDFLVLLVDDAEMLLVPRLRELRAPADGARLPHS